MGCSTKWREKKALHDAKHEEWAKTPVAVELIDKAGIAKLRANTTNKYRVINVWATWCAPCVKEFPDLVEISRKFDMRDFELVTISLDKPEDKAKAEAFLFKQAAGLSKKVAGSLKKEGRTTNSYLFAGSGDDLVAALDKDMPGPIPHTIVVAPGGEIVYRHTGVIDLAETENAILDKMNRFYSPAAPKK
jgi:thiol-disulfide isomerase/thioredoxin